MKVGCLMSHAFRFTALLVLLSVVVSQAAEPKPPASSPPKGTLRLAADKTKGLFSGFKKPAPKADEKANSDRPAAVKARETTTAVKTVKLDGHALMLGQEDQLALTAEQFRQQAADQLQANQRHGLTQLVRRYPDIALQTLRDSLSSAAPDKTLDAIAAAFDAMWSNSSSNNGWTAALAVKASSPQWTSRMLPALARTASTLAATLSGRSAPPPSVTARICRCLR